MLLNRTRKSARLAEEAVKEKQSHLSYLEALPFPSLRHSDLLSGRIVQPGVGLLNGEFVQIFGSPV